jgi:allantoate deiminase
MSLDVRHAADAARAQHAAALRAAAERAAASRGLGLDWAVLLDQPAVPLDPRLTDSLAAAAGEPRRLVSGAGHDAAVVARIAPAAMLFVRCAGGVSHSPAESVREADVAAALDALTHVVLRQA